MIDEHVTLSALRNMARNRESAVRFARELQDASTDEDVRVGQAVLALRQMAGTPLPFSTTDAEGQSNQFYLPSIAIFNNATACMRPGTGTYYAHCLLEQPEGRHQCFFRVLNEVIGCMNLMGINVEREHAFALIADLKKPKNDLDSLIQRMGKLLLTRPTRLMTPENLLEVHDRLLAGLSMDLASRLDERINTERRKAVLQSVCDYVHGRGDHPDHPMIRALFAAMHIRVIKPFPTINIVMARIVFSWAASEVGLPLAALSPVAAFLDEWNRNAVSKPEQAPEISYEAALLKTDSGGTDWSPWLEVVLDFLADDLDHFETRLLRLLMKRERVEHLVKFEKGLNERQRTIVAELLLHDDAEFTYAIVMEMFGVAYATAYADLGKLEAKGYVKTVPLKKATVFIASDDCREVFHRRVREAAPEEYARFYTEDGELTPEYLERQAEILDRYKKSMPDRSEYIHISRPNLLPERCLVILTETDGKKQRG